MIAALADTLRSAGLQVTIEELQDIVWLASRLDVHTQRAAQGRAAPAQEDSPAPSDAGAQDEAVAVPPDPEPLPLPLPQPESDTLVFPDNPDGQLRASVLRVPGVAGSGAPEYFRRALQPFARRVASRWDTRLDEEATAARAADTGLWMPVMRAARERCFDLSLVIEDCAVADLRRAAVSELTHIFRSYSGLRSVTAYRLDGETGARLIELDSGAVHGVEHLRRRDPRHLVLFATDGISARWRDGRAQNFLHVVGAAAAVSILHLLPRRAWRHTLIGEPELAMYAPRAGDPNARFHALLPWWLDDGAAQGALPVPVLGLDPESAGVWARTMCARGGATVQGVLVSRAGALANEAEPALTAPAELVGRYRSMVSMEAYSLAVYLAMIDPLTVPVMRLIQRTMLPDSGDGELAEFVIGGLIAPFATAAASERQYRFRDGVRTELIKALRYSEERKIESQLHIVGRFLEEKASATAGFEARFPTPNGRLRLSEWTLPFAEVSQQMLRRFGGGTPNPRPVVASAPAALRSTLRILHLSDLHTGSEDERGPLGVRDEFGGEWLANLQTIMADGAVDLVCVSGDLTWRATPAQFEAAGVFLDATLKCLGLGRQRLFVVPGNHDVFRIVNKIEHSESIANADEGGEPLPESTTGRIGDGNVKPSEPLANFRAWVRRFLPHQDAAMVKSHGAYRLELDGWAMPVHVLGLDSSSSGLAKRPLPALIAHQLQDLLPSPNDITVDGLIVGLMHHSPEWMSQSDRTRHDLAAAGVQLLMTGHAQKNNTDIAQIDSETIVLESCGTGLSARGGMPNAIRVIDLEMQEAPRCQIRQFWTRTWSYKTMHWLSNATQFWDARGNLLPHVEKIPEEKRAANFVGRSYELNRLAAIFDDFAASERPQSCVFIAGQAGVGKSALAIEFASEYWANSSFGSGRANHLTLNYLSGKGIRSLLIASLPIKTTPHSVYQDAVTYLRESKTLLIIDGIDGDDALLSVKHEVFLLPGCPILLIGRVDDQPDIWITVTLGPLELKEAVHLLRLCAPESDASLVELEAVAQATRGIPAALVLAAGALNVGTIAEHAVAELDVNSIRGQPAEPESNQNYNANYEQLFVAWETTNAQPGWSNALTALAHAPVKSTNLLNAALCGLLRDDLPYPDAIADYKEFCRSAPGMGSVNRDGLFMLGERARTWLRVKQPGQAAVVAQRWTAWVQKCLNSGAVAGTHGWKQLNEVHSVLEAWLGNCTLEEGTSIRELFIPYACENGPLDVWRKFCQRMVDVLSPQSPERIDWYWSAAQLAHFAGDSDFAIIVIERHGLLAQRDPSMPQIGELVETMRQKILDSRKNITLMVDRMYPHQEEIAELAFAATVSAFSGGTHAGTVTQALGTGLTNSMLAYLAKCRASKELRGVPCIVIVDRIALATQIMHQLREWPVQGVGLDALESESVEHLRRMLEQIKSGVIVTTKQKIILIEEVLEMPCLVVYFNLREPDIRYIHLLPNSKLIVFTSNPFFKPEQAKSFGEPIANYLQQQAIEEGFLLPVRVRSRFHLVDPPPLLDAGFRHDGIKEFVMQLLMELPRKSTLFKAVLVLNDRKLADALVREIYVQLHNGEDSAHEFHVLTHFAADENLPHVLGFNRQDECTALLIVTRGTLTGLELVGVDVCYVGCKLPQLLQLKVQSFVNRPAPGKTHGNIVDLAKNEWVELANSDIPAAE